jgi:hypothetical protein
LESIYSQRLPCLSQKKIQRRFSDEAWSRRGRCWEAATRATQGHALHPLEAALPPGAGRWGRSLGCAARWADQWEKFHRKSKVCGGKGWEIHGKGELTHGGSRRAVGSGFDDVARGNQDAEGRWDEGAGVKCVGGEGWR